MRKNVGVLMKSDVWGRKDEKLEGASGEVSIKCGEMGGRIRILRLNS